MKLARRTNRNKYTRLGQRAILGFGMLVIALCMLLAVFGAPAATTVRAQGPIEYAQQTIAAATVQAQQTSSARAAELASQQMTASALDNQRRVAALTQQAADYQATRSMANVQTTQTAVANQTAQSVHAAATAVAVSISVEQTRVVDQQRRDEATRTFERTRTFEQAQSDNATRTTQQIQAIQTADARSTQVAQERQAAAEERDAAVQTLGTLAIITALVFALVATGRYAWQRAKPRPIVQVVAEETRGVSASEAPRDSNQAAATTQPTIERIPQTQDNSADRTRAEWIGWKDPETSVEWTVRDDHPNTAGLPFPPADGPEPLTTVSPPSDAVTQIVLDLILKQEQANRGSGDSNPDSTIQPSGTAAASIE